MSDEAPEILDAVAGIVADFGPIDWEELTVANAGMADTLAILRQLQGISSGHREAIRTGASGTVASNIARTEHPFAGRPGGPATHAFTRSDPVRGAPSVSARSKPSKRSGPARSTHEDLPFTWGPLIVHEKLASGANGDVYRAYDSKLQREVALKLRLAPPSLESDPLGQSDFISDVALTEARRLARVRHPNVLSVHGADVFDGSVGIWTDLLRGQTLEERLRREGAIRATEAALVGINLCRALRAVHEAGLVHGDVKAANVMRDEEGTIVLLDFGSARFSEDLEDRVSGTPLVMAPEVLLGSDPSSVSDLYSLGVLIYRLVTAAYPIEANSVEELADKHRSGQSVPLSVRSPSLSASFVRIVETAMRSDPTERFASAREMEHALEMFLEEEQTAHRALRAASALHNLPSEFSTFIGRDGPIRQLKHLVHEHRLITITGVGGAGKTRLALQVAGSVLVGQFDEIRWVELAGCSDPLRIEPEIAASFGLRDTAQSLASLLSERLSGRAGLLMMDNCEHLLEASGAVIAELLRTVPGLTVMATSREPLRVSGEIVYAVAPLELPLDGTHDLDEMRRSESIALFLDRAAATGTPLVLDGESAPLLLRICRRLEGLPLAIELAAARVRSLSLAQISSRLDDRFRLLTGGPSGKPRHQTLRALIDWSYGLLNQQEQRLFLRLGIFTGGWTVEAAEQVASGGGIELEEVLDLTERLLDKSLIERLPGTAGGEARYRMLETIREYARAGLGRSGEQEEVTRRHRNHFVSLARDVAFHLRTSQEKHWMSRLRSDLDNVRSALDSGLAVLGEGRTGIGVETEGATAIDAREAESVNELAAYMARLWFGLDLWNEGRSYCRRFLSRPDPQGNDSLHRFHLSAAAGFLAVQQGDFEESGRLFGEALRIAELRGETPLLQTAHAYHGNLAFTQGRAVEAKAHQERALTLAREMKDARRINIALSNLGNIFELLGERDQMKRAHEESLEWARQTGDVRSIAYSLGRLGEGSLQEGRFQDARRFLAESLELRREIGDRWGIAAASCGLADIGILTKNSEGVQELLDEAATIFEELGDAGSLARTFGRMAEFEIARGELDRARSHAERTLEIVAGLGERRDFANNLVVLATIENAAGHLEHAGLLLGGAERVYAELDGPPAPHSVETMAGERAKLVAALGEEECSRLIAEGRALDDAALFALTTRMRKTR